MPKAKTMSDAAAKYDRKADAMGTRWDGKKSSMKTEWPKGILSFYGTSPGPISSKAYNDGLDAISATTFAERVRGKGSKVMEKAKAGLAI